MQYACNAGHAICAHGAILLRMKRSAKCIVCCIVVISALQFGLLDLLPLEFYLAVFDHRSTCSALMAVTWPSQAESLTKATVQSPPIRRSRIMCLVPTTWDEERTHWSAILASWGGRCDALRFFVAGPGSVVEQHAQNVVNPVSGNESEHVQRARAFEASAIRLAASQGLVADVRVVILQLRGPDTYANLWQKVRLAWLYAAAEVGLKSGHSSSGKGRQTTEQVAQPRAQIHIDWFIKLDTDSFLAVDNLRDFVDGKRKRNSDKRNRATALNPSDLHYLGHALHGGCGWSGVAHNSGAGYVLSYGALRAVAPWLHGKQRVENAQMWAWWPRQVWPHCADIVRSSEHGKNTAVRLNKLNAKHKLVTSNDATTTKAVGELAGLAEDIAMSVCLRDAGVRVGVDSRCKNGDDRFFIHTRAVERARVRGGFGRHRGRGHNKLHLGVRDDTDLCTTTPILFHQYKSSTHASFYMELQALADHKQRTMNQ